MVEALVAYASRMGGTAEIAEVVGQVLRERGVGARVVPCADVTGLEGVDAVLVGSAVYLRRWQRDALAFLERFGPELAARQTWLFQSGPCGPDDHDPAPGVAVDGAPTHEEALGDDARDPDADPGDSDSGDDDPGDGADEAGGAGGDAGEWGRVPRRVVQLAARFGLPHPVTFGGRLDPAHAHDPLSRWVAAGPLAGDRRDWAAIRAWADACATAVLDAGPYGASPELAAALEPAGPARTEGPRPDVGATSGTKDPVPTVPEAVEWS